MDMIHSSAVVLNIIKTETSMHMHPVPKICNCKYLRFGVLLTSSLALRCLSALQFAMEHHKLTFLICISG